MKTALTPMLVAAMTLAATGVAFATDDVTSLSYISYLERYATVRPGQDDEALEAVVNMPILSGDRVETSRGSRMEIQLADGCTLWLDEFSALDLDAVAGSRDEPASRTAVFLAQGGAALEVPENALGEQAVRVDSDLGSTLLERPGLYRLDLAGDGLRVQTHSGLAELPAGVGSVLLRSGQEAFVDGRGGVDKYSLRAGLDDFWAWVEGRRRTVASGYSSEHVDGAVASRARVLDGYGEWVYLTSHSSWMWRPRVAGGWVPYSYGRWYWTPVGWSWISYEPWGWLPYHYGSWYWDVGFGWVWSWDRVWAPSWVHWFHYPGYVGWCPRGYYDGWYFDNCHDCRGGNRHDPHRWRHSALDFSGRVRLRDVDPRPWTFVRSESFVHSRLDRVRIDPTRLLRDLPGDDFGQVRSGPLVTPSRERDGAGRSVEATLRGVVSDRDLPDLSAMLRRDADSASRLGDLPVRPLRTTDVQQPTRRSAGSVDPGTSSSRGLPTVGRTDPGPGAGSVRPRSTPGSVDPGTGTSPRPTVRTRPDDPTDPGSPRPANPPRTVDRPTATPGRRVTTQPATPSRPQVQRDTPRAPDTSSTPSPKSRVELPGQPPDPPPPTLSSSRSPARLRTAGVQAPLRTSRLPSSSGSAASRSLAPATERSRATKVAPTNVRTLRPVHSGDPAASARSYPASSRQQAPASPSTVRGGSLARAASPPPAVRSGPSPHTASPPARVSSGSPPQTASAPPSTRSSPSSNSGPSSSRPARTRSRD